jgi:hypothetical protein
MSASIRGGGAYIEASAREVETWQRGDLVAGRSGQHHRRDGQHQVIVRKKIAFVVRLAVNTSLWLLDLLAPAALTLGTLSALGTHSIATGSTFDRPQSFCRRERLRPSSSFG